MYIPIFLLKKYQLLIVFSYFKSSLILEFPEVKYAYNYLYMSTSKFSR
jgi:hypothetical protein